MILVSGVQQSLTIAEKPWLELRYNCLSFLLAKTVTKMVHKSRSIKSALKRVPDGPGVYYLKNARNKIVYIGKAANLAHRLTHYFRSKAAPAFGPKSLMLNEIKSFRYHETASEIEALIQEARDIKKRQPKYNILLKDDKQFLSIIITQDDPPRVLLTHQPRNHLRPKEIYGPFAKSREIKRLMRFIRKVLPYRTCKNPLEKPCLESKLGLCPIHDLKKREAYSANLELIRMILKGRVNGIQNLINRRMRKAVDRQCFEEAATWRNLAEIFENVIQHRPLLENRPLPPISRQFSVKNRQKVLLGIKKTLHLPRFPRRIEVFDISNLGQKSATGSMVVFIAGVAAPRHYRRFRIQHQIGGDPHMIAEVIKRRGAHPQWGIPDLILIDGGKAQLNAAFKAMHEWRREQFPKLPSLSSLAKRGNILYTKDNNVVETFPLANLPAAQRLFFELLITQAHRFAINYHRQRRRLDLADRLKQ